VDFPISFSSYGEVMTIEIHKNDTISACCRSKNRRSTLDRVRNEFNIRWFFYKLSKELGLVGKKPAKAGKSSKKWGIKRVIGSDTGEPEEGALIDR
jgi:hypothetical protein